MPSAVRSSTPLALALALAGAGCGWNEPDYVYDTDTSTGTSGGTTTSGATTSGGTTTAATSTGSESGTSGTSGTSEGSTGGTSSTTGSAEDMAICTAAKAIALLEPTAVAESEPWNPGEVITVGAILHNTGGADFLYYPGIKVSADHPLVTSGQPENWFYAIFADMQSPLGVTFVADESIAPGAAVTFTIEVVVLGKSCPDLASVTVKATVM